MDNTNSNSFSADTIAILNWSYVKMNLYWPSNSNERKEKNVNKVQLDLTEEIGIFLSVVYKASANSNMKRESLNLDAR